MTSMRLNPVMPARVVLKPALHTYTSRLGQPKKKYCFRSTARLGIFFRATRVDFFKKKFVVEKFEKNEEYQ